MSELKITIDQLKNYLGTGLKCHSPSIDGDYRRDANVPVTFDVYGLTDHYPMIDCSVLQTDSDYDDLKPICYRLSDLDKFIPELGFVPLQELFPKWKWDEETESEKWFLDDDLIMKSKSYQLLKGPTLSFDQIQQLFQWHFWPFGDEYFEAGLVIDKLRLQDHA